MGALVMVECKTCGGVGRLPDGEGDSMKCGSCEAGERRCCELHDVLLVEGEDECPLCTDTVAYLELVASLVRERDDTLEHGFDVLPDHQPFAGDEEITSHGTPTDMPSCRRSA